MIQKRKQFLCRYDHKWDHVLVLRKMADRNKFSIVDLFRGQSPRLFSMSPFHQPWARSKNGTPSTLRTHWFVQADTLWTSDLIGRGIWIDKDNSMKTGRQEVESKRGFYKHTFTNRIRASIQWDKSEKHTRSTEHTAHANMWDPKFPLC